MDFIDQIKNLSVKVSKLQDLNSLETEEATKNAIIMPFINILGYNVFDTMEVVPEFTTDVGIKKGEKVDYAIIKDGKPIMLFECKSSTVDLQKEHASQLYRYFAVSDAIIGVLTNGISYKFYSDLEEDNKMDTNPFLEFDLLDIKEPLVTELKRFRKESFESDEITLAANELKYTNEIKRIMEDEINSPSIEFVKFFTKKKRVFSGKLTKSREQQFIDIARRAFKQFINEKIHDRLKSALEEGSSSEKQDLNVPSDEKKDDRIVTTEEEMEGFYIVRAILREVVDPERVFYKDWKGYFNIQLDNNIRKPICKLYFNTRQKYISFFDENKKEEKIAIENLTEIYNYSDRIRATIGYYDKKIESKTILDE